MEPQVRPSVITTLLAELRDGRREALDELYPRVYEQLREIGRRQLARRGADSLLGTTALVNELYLRLIEQTHIHWRDRGHFFAVAAMAMRQILVDRARERLAAKRGGGRQRTTLADVAAADVQAEEVLSIDDALSRLAALDPRLARVVECRFFGGLSEEETAEALGIGERTVRRDWTKARALLAASLGD